MPLLLTIALISVLAACGSNPPRKTFSELGIATAAKESYDAAGSPKALLYSGASDDRSGSLDIYFYRLTDESLPDPGSYQCSTDTSNLAAGEAAFAYAYSSGTSIYALAAVSGTITVSGSTVSFEDVVFEESLIDFYS